MKTFISRSIGITILFFLLLFMVQGNLFVANAEVSLPNPSLPNPSLPNPSLPNPSLPNPSLSDANLSNSTLPGVDVDSSENGTNTDGSSNNDDKGWIDSLTDFAQSVGDKLDSFTQNAIDTLGDIGSSILDGLAEAGQWIADNWEFTAAVVAGVGLTIAGIFVAPLLPIGLAILAGIAISGGIGYFTGLRGEDLTKEMGIGGALGAIGGGLLGSMAKVVGAGGIGLKNLVTGNALSGAITSMADDILHNRKLSIPKAVIGAALGVGLTVLLVGGQGLGLANKLMNPVQVSKPTVSSQKVDMPDGAGKGSGTLAGEGKNTILSMSVNDFSENVQNSFYKYNKSGWKGNIAGQTAGTKAGSAYRNSDGALPKTDEVGNPITYKEFDVNNKLPNEGRDAERFIIGSDGSIYYTDSHYGDTQSPTGIPSFVKLK